MSWLADRQFWHSYNMRILPHQFQFLCITVRQIETETHGIDAEHVSRELCTIAVL